MEDTQELTFVLDLLRQHPEIWFPSPDDEEEWEQFVAEAARQAEAMGVDLDASRRKRNEQ